MLLLALAGGGNSTGLAVRGVLYTPTACRRASPAAKAAAACKLHINLHGCNMAEDRLGLRYVQNAGFAEWAETNRLVVLFPQTGGNYTDPLSGFSWVANCWDNYGFTGLDYAERTGPMMAPVHRMLRHLTTESPMRSVRSAVMKGDDDGAIMPHLEIPKFPPQWNLTMSTMTQLCFGPTPLGGIPLNNESGQFLRKWGVIEIDFESEESLWAHHVGGKDADVMMLEQATAMKAIAPASQIWIYRNLVQAYANFVQFREKLEDPAYAGWWLKFDDATNDEKLTPRCGFNSRLNRTLCSDLFHSPLRWTHDGNDCGDVIPCGDYVFDHRNASLRTWLVEEHMLGPMGLAHPSVDGFGCIDDWYAGIARVQGGDTTRGGGPTEVQHFVKGTGITQTSSAMLELMGNWSVTTWAINAAVTAAGGFMHSNLNCALDVDACTSPAPALDPPHAMFGCRMKSVGRCSSTRPPIV